MSSIDPRDLLKAGGHFGHKTSRWHPKMAPYIFDAKQGVHIIDLTKTVTLLDDALAFVEKTVAGGKDVLIVGTKRQAKSVVKDMAEKTGMPYVVERWLGGMLTNHSTMGERIKHLKQLEKQMESGELEAKYNKLEVQRFQEDIDKLNLNFSGIKEMKGQPGAVIVVDVVEENNAVNEANKLHIPVVGICDTNANPQNIDFVVPCNDDAIKAIQLLADAFAGAIDKGLAKRGAAEPKEDKEGGK
ncbi:TPA: 30S ribosomal protein S2 [Candidatus Saccharibacteria bacterium]|nr:30S ribosomal protein S2 [Candidatus Saccharibacteria bacterium]HIO87221.1 30S ribosomal protein S2 [Candidatus Saccharibacteria bacterium]